LEYAIEQLVRKGLNRSLLSERLLVSPACGLGAVDPAKTEAIFGLLAKISEEIRGD
jgi:hypothetical protein